MCKPNTALGRKFSSKIHGIFGYTVNFSANIKQTVSTIPSPPLLSQLQPILTRIWQNSRRLNSNSSQPNLDLPIYKSKFDRLEFCQILVGIDWSWDSKGGEGIVETVCLIFALKFTVFSNIPWILELNFLPIAVFGLHIQF